MRITVSQGDKAIARKRAVKFRFTFGLSRSKREAICTQREDNAERAVYDAREFPRERIDNRTLRKSARDS